MKVPNTLDHRSNNGRESFATSNSLRFKSQATVELGLADLQRVEFELLPESLLRFSEKHHRHMFKTKTIDKHIYLCLDKPIVYEIPVLSKSGQLFPIIIGALEAIKSGGEIRLSQKRSNGEIASGFSIQY